MNDRQKEVQKSLIEDERKVLKQLKQVYTKASQDCSDKIRELSMRTDMENLQSIIYQKRYQEALKKQIDEAIKDLDSKTYDTITEYLNGCYENNFLGTLYDLQGQGVPLIFPIDQEQAVKAVQLDSQISQGLYAKLGEDTIYLKRSIKAEVSRGIVSGESWNVIASHIAMGMRSPFNSAYNRAVRIARTEGHRIQQEAALNCQERAKSKGADVVKQWDSTLDGVTRPTHRALDGQVREVEEAFEANGMSAMYPGGFGIASEDCNCRCCLLQRARWALSEEEYYTKFNGDKNELVTIRAKSYDEFRKEFFGLKAKNRTLADIPEHQPAEFVKNIDIKNNLLIQKEIEAFENMYANADLENAIVITSKGNVYHCYGVEDGVFPDIDLGDELVGAIISHNHPKSATEYTFSGSDVALFTQYKLERLRGVDYKYCYELTNDESIIDEYPVDWTTEENIQHASMIDRCKIRELGYHRWLK